MTQIPADANTVIDQLSQQIGTLNKLAAALKLIPKDVLDSLDKENTNAED